MADTTRVSPEMLALTPEPLTAEAFAEFGSVVGPGKLVLTSTEFPFFTNVATLEPDHPRQPAPRPQPDLRDVRRQADDRRRRFAALERRRAAPRRHSGLRHRRQHGDRLSRRYLAP